MRDIEFRGKDIDRNKLRYGNFAKIRENDGTLLYYIIDEENQQWIVFPNTVDQYTGINTIDNIMIFEGDIISSSNDDDDYDLWTIDDMPKHVVEYKNNYFDFGMYDLNPNDDESIYSYKFIKILGNVHDNPELLK